MKPAYAGSRHDKWHKYGSLVVWSIGFILYALGAGPGWAMVRLMGGGMAVIMIWWADDLAVCLSSHGRCFFSPATTDSAIRLYGWLALFFNTGLWLTREYELLG